MCSIRLVSCSIFSASALLAGSLLLQPSSHAQTGSARGQTASPRNSAHSPSVYRHRVIPHWSTNNDRFWYRNDLRDAQREFVLVDANTGLRRPAFDHTAVAIAMGLDASAAKSLPIDSLRFFEDSEAIGLLGPETTWLWDPQQQRLDAQPIAPEPPASNRQAEGFRPKRTGAESEIIFENRTRDEVEIFWMSGNGTTQSYGTIPAGKRRAQHTFGGHRWLVRNQRGESLSEISADDTSTTVVLDGRPLRDTESSRRRERGSPLARDIDRSPDGKWRAVIENHNVVLRGVDSNESIALTTDGRPDLAYGHLAWAPDSKALVAFRKQSKQIPDVYLVQSSPKEGGRAKLQTRPYALPGDPFPRYELNILHIDTRQHLKPAVDWFEHEWQHPEVRWAPTSSHFTYQQTDRGHQRFRLIQVQTDTGDVRPIIDEKTNTFIWTAHTEQQAFSTINWLAKTPELIYVTERSGWRHLVLIDTRDPSQPRALTSGEWVIRGIEHIDEEARQVWFHASGVFDQDPYLVHYGRVNFDGTGLTWLTAGDGHHTIQLSPDRRYLIDTYSRVDLPPVTELRRVTNGALICELERADISELEEARWSAPEVFSAAGRDGKTSIWGIICRPRDFDPGRHYPVIEDIYAGPHGASVPKTFSASQRYRELTDLGFIVVKIDGMGTAHRSKAFHDVCWQNLKDAGFEDRKCWLRAAAARYPQLDLTRVGIYGTSAGGQNAAAALLFHSDFYKVAVAACGCHDNRMDKASWNEQWMGYPVGPHYSACSNIDNADKLQGKLLLIVGEMDTNVPPESTLRFANALIQANKDFDMLLIPNGGHGMGGVYGQRKLQDFFVRHLLNTSSTVP